MTVAQESLNPLAFTISFGGFLFGVAQPLIGAAGVGATPNPTVTASTGSDLTKVDGGELVLAGTSSYRGVTHIGLAAVFGDASRSTRAWPAAS